MEQILKDDIARIRDSPLQDGCGGETGSFCDSGAFRLTADGRVEARRVEAEAVVSAPCLFRSTGEKRHPGVFERTFRFIDDTLIGRDAASGSNSSRRVVVISACPRLLTPSVTSYLLPGQACVPSGRQH